MSLLIWGLYFFQEDLSFLPVAPFFSHHKCPKDAPFSLGSHLIPVIRPPQDCHPLVLYTGELFPINSPVTRARANHVSDILWVHAHALSVSYFTRVLCGVLLPAVLSFLCRIFVGPSWGLWVGGLLGFPLRGLPICFSLNPPIKTSYGSIWLIPLV